jgi:hypothetical protein
MHSRYLETPVRAAAPAAETSPPTQKNAAAVAQIHAPVPQTRAGRDTGDILLLLITLFLCLESDDDEVLILLALLLFAGY